MLTLEEVGWANNPFMKHFIIAVTGLRGVLTYTWGGNAASPNAYRVRPLGTLGGSAPDFQPTNARPSAPNPRISGAERR